MSGSNRGSIYVAGAVQGFTTLVQSMAAAVQSWASVDIDLTVGSVVRALLEAQAGVTLWLEGLVLQVMTMMRLSTSVGADVDSFLADWEFTRVGAVAATCNTVVFSRFTATNAATVPAGSSCLTTDGTQSFIVIADPGQSTWNAGQNAYVIPASTSSATVTAQAVTPGAAGNVSANSITLLTSNIVGVDTVNNIGAASGGINGESDAAARARFALYIQSLARSTVAAIEYGVTSIQPGLDVNIVQNYTYPGNPGGIWSPGSLFVVLDDGTGIPPSSLITAAQNVVNAYRAATVQYYVYAPSVLPVNVGGAVVESAGYVHATVVANVTAAIIAYLNSHVIQQPCPMAEVIAVAMGVPGCQNFFSVTLNSGTADIVPTAVQLVKAVAVTVI